MVTIVGGNGGGTSNGNDAENDSIWGAGGGDILRGGPAAGTGGGNDLLDGGTGSDLIYGGDGADTLIGGEGTGSDTLYGGAGVDTADYSRYLTALSSVGGGSSTFALNTAAVNVNLETTSVTGGLGADRIFEVENVIGGGGADTITGNTAGNLLEGGGGSDSLFGGVGNDTLLGGAGVDTIFGGNDGDLAYGGTEGDLVYGDTGTDTLFGEAGIDTLFGGADSDLAYGGDDADLLYGDSGNDTLSGDAAADTVYGGAGEDDLSGGAGIDQIFGGFGNDTISSGTEADTVFGGAGNDTVDGGTGADLIYGGPETTTGLQFNWSDYSDEQNLASGVVQDVGGINVTVSYNGGFPGATFSAETTGSTGGTEREFPIYVGAGEPFNANSSAEFFRPADGSGSTSSTVQFDFAAIAGSDLDSAVRNLSFRISDVDLAGFTDQVTVRAYDANGVEIPVTITVGNTGTLSLSGNTVTATGGGVNPNSLDGSILYQVAGPVARLVIDYTDLNNAQQAIRVSDLHFDAIPALDNDSLIGGDGSDTVYGGEGLDTILGNIGDDRIYGGFGSDSIDAGDGADLVYGDDGNDNIQFGNGADTVYGGTGNDIIDDLTASAAVGANLIFGGAGNDVMWSGNDADTLYGDAGNDVMSGEVGNDLLFGGLDNDQLFGGSDHDTLYGETGNDTLTGDSGADQIFGGDNSDLAYGGLGADTLYGDAGTDTLYGGDDGDLAYGGTESDLLSGGGGIDTLFGDAGNDTLLGDAGNDILFGGVGNDSIVGGDDQDLINVGYNSAYNSVLAANDVATGEVVDGGSGGVDNDTLRVDITGLGWGRIDLVYDPSNNENGTITFFDAGGAIVGTLAFTEIENVVIVCFTAGTRIMTDRGPVAVETLTPGDLVVTRDRGLQPLRWVGTRTLSYFELQARPNLQPVRIGMGAFAEAGPERTMLVSPQHRLLIEGARAEMYFGESEVLVPAKHLTGLAEVTRALPPEGVTYVHILFDRHEIVQSDGLWTESFQPAERTLNALEESARAEVLELFPELAGDATLYPAARLTLKAHEARVLVSD